MIAKSLIFYSASIAQRLITQPLELKPGQYEGIIWFSPVFQVIFFPVSLVSLIIKLMNSWNDDAAEESQE